MYKTERDQDTSGRSRYEHQKDDQLRLESRENRDRQSRYSDRYYKRDDRYDRRDDRYDRRDDRYDRRDDRYDRRNDRYDRRSDRHERQDDRHDRRDERHERQFRERSRRSDYDRKNGSSKRRARSKSPSKSFAIDESTIDWDKIVPIEEWKVKDSKWDIKPPGYESVSADQAKMSGLFPLPGAPKSAVMDSEKLKKFAEENKDAIAPVLKLISNNARQNRRLLLTNLPDGIADADVTNWFNEQLNELNGVASMNSLHICHISHEKNIALVQFRSNEDATLALYFLNGAEFLNSKIDISRPEGYIQPKGQISDSNHCLDQVKDSEFKLAIKNIPEMFNESQIKELLTPFGTLHSFILIRDRGNNESKGLAFCEYKALKDSSAAIKGLDKMEISGKELSVNFACPGPIEPSVDPEEDKSIMRVMELMKLAEKGKPSCVLQLFNMVLAEEMQDLSEYQDILSEIKMECSKYGNVIEVKIPRPTGGSRLNYGVGKVYVQFESIGAAESAMNGLTSRKFLDRTIVPSFFPETNFEVGLW